METTATPAEVYRKWFEKLTMYWPHYALLNEWLRAGLMFTLLFLSLAEFTSYP